MNLLTYNVHGFYEMENWPSGDGGLEFRDFLITNSIEVLCLQECYQDPPKIIADLYQKIICNTETGLAILTNYELVDSTFEYLGDDKGCFQMKLVYPAHQKEGKHKKTSVLNLFNLHLDHRSETTRYRQLLTILPKILAAKIDGETLVVGDFNSLTRSDYSEEVWKYMVTKEYSYTAKMSLVIPEITKHLFDTFKEKEDTNSNGVPATSIHRRRVDYVFTNRQDHRKSKIIRDLKLSDHFPVLYPLIQEW